MPKDNLSFDQRFWKYVDTDSTDCYLWTGGKDWCGYGMFNAERTIRAHIFAWRQIYGPPPIGMIVSHLCNTPCCVNIDHLTLMTNAENAAYRVACGRARGGKIGSGDFGWSWYTGRQKPYETAAVRFWKNIQRSDGCWLWTGSRQQNGYGIMWYDGKVVKAHRMMWLETIGPIPEGLDVLHKCDVRNCVRLDHLELGTDLENARQREERGRGKQQRGERCGATKYPDSLVHKAKALYRPKTFGYRAVGEAIGVPTHSVPYLIHKRIV